MSAEAETDNPQSELKPGIDLLGQVDELFFDMYDRYEPVNEPSLDNCFVSTVSSAFCNNKVITSLRYFRCLWKLSSLQSYDATTHFETTVTDVLSMYTAITGKVWFMSYLFLLFLWSAKQMYVSNTNFFNVVLGLRVQNLLVNFAIFTLNGQLFVNLLSAIDDLPRNKINP